MYITFNNKDLIRHIVMQHIKMMLLWPLSIFPTNQFEVLLIQNYIFIQYCIVLHTLTF